MVVIVGPKPLMTISATLFVHAILKEATAIPIFSYLILREILRDSNMFCLQQALEFSKRKLEVGNACRFCCLFV